MNSFILLPRIARVMSTISLILAATVLMTGTVEAKTLRVAYYIGDKHPLVTSGINLFMSEVKKADSSIDFRVFPAGQLGKPKDSIKTLQNGLADIALIVLPYHREELPITQVINLPWEADIWTLTNAFMRTTIDAGPIHDEWKKQGIVPLIAAANPPYEIHSGSKPLSSLAAVSGMKIRSPGGAYDDILSAAGVVSVAVPTPETFEAITRGTIDGTVYAFSNWNSMRLQEALKHTTVNLALPSPGGLTFSISRKTFDSLTPEQQALLIKIGRDVSIKAQAALLSENESALAEFKAKGLKTYEWSKENRAVLQEKLSSVRTNWIKNMDAADRPGTKAAGDFARQLKSAQGAPRDFPLRPH